MVDRQNRRHNVIVKSYRPGLLNSEKEVQEVVDEATALAKLQHRCAAGLADAAVCLYCVSFNGSVK